MLGIYSEETWFGHRLGRSL